MFEYLNKILFKTKTPDTENLDENSEFQPYLVQRWCSMYSPEVTALLNQTSNIHWSTLQGNTEWFNYLHSIVPKTRFKRINYIKKKRETENKTTQKQILQKVANNLEISSREVNLYIEQFNLQLPNEKK
jgi:hypothetical protein